MKTIIAGSRHVHSEYGQRLVREALKASGFFDEITEIIHGAARGIDLAAHEVCNGAWPVTAVPAEWAKHGRRAGSIRNAEMASMADALIAIWDGVSLGTKNMIDAANAKGLRVYVYRFQPSGN